MDEIKSIAYMISSYDIYGAGKVIFNEMRVRQQKAKKTILILIWPNTKTPFIEKVEKTDIPFYHLISRSKFDLLAIIKLMGFLRKNNVGLLHSNGYKSDIIGLIACRLLNIPIVTTVHGWCSEDWKAKIYEKMQAFCWRFFGRVICVSESYKQKALQFGVSESKLRVVYNGIAVDDYMINDSKDVKRCFLTKYDIPLHHFVVGIIGRLSIEKGHRYFVEAAHKVLEQEHNVSFLIVGDGPQENSIKRMIDQLRLNKYIHIVGYVENMKEIYASLDAAVIASLREGLPNVLLEAMACEKPVVATNVGGIPEVIRDNREGILVPPKNSSAITDALLTLIRNPEQGRRIASGAKKRVLEDFTFENRMKQIENLYDEVIQKYRLN